MEDFNEQHVTIAEISVAIALMTQAITAALIENLQGQLIATNDIGKYFKQSAVDIENVRAKLLMNNIGSLLLGSLPISLN